MPIATPPTTRSNHAPSVRDSHSSSSLHPAAATWRDLRGRVRGWGYPPLHAPGSESFSVLVGNRGENEQVGSQSHAVKQHAARLWIRDEQKACAIDALDQERRRKPEKQRVTCLAPELQEIGSRNEGGG